MEVEQRKTWAGEADYCGVSINYRHPLIRLWEIVFGVCVSALDFLVLGLLIIGDNLDSM